MVLSLFVAISTSSIVRNNPRFPDFTRGYTIPLSIRGLGTRYMTQKQWDSIAAYWDVFYVFLGLFVTTIVTRIILEAYKRFIASGANQSRGP